MKKKNTFLKEQEKEQILGFIRGHKLWNALTWDFFSNPERGETMSSWMREQQPSRSVSRGLAYQ